MASFLTAPHVGARRDPGRYKLPLGEGAGPPPPMTRTLGFHLPETFILLLIKLGG